MAEIEMTEQERAALQHLIDLARHVDHALDDSEEVQEDGLRSHIIQAQDFDDVVEAIDALNDLPDDKPGVTMNPSDKAEWALRRILVRHIATAPAAVAGPLNELEELNLLNKLIALGAKAAHAHAQSNRDDGHKGTAAYVQWQELRAEMGELIRNAYAAPTAQPAPQQEPVAWQSRMRPTWGSNTVQWSPWGNCTKGQAEDYWKTPVLNEWAYEARALYTEPQPSPAAQEGK